MAKQKRDTVEVFKSRDGWMFRLKAANHEVISLSESYTRRWDATRGARRAHPRARLVMVG